MRDSLLAQLRDIHLPPYISFWPMAIGWYFLVVLFVAIFLVAGFLLWKKYQKLKRKKIILTEWKNLRSAVIDGHRQAFEIGIFVRRVVIKCGASLGNQSFGQAWIDFLNKWYPKNKLSSELAYFLKEGVYKQETLPSSSTLDELERWLARIIL